MEYSTPRSELDVAPSKGSTVDSEPDTLLDSGAQPEVPPRLLWSVAVLATVLLSLSSARAQQGLHSCLRARHAPGLWHPARSASLPRSLRVLHAVVPLTLPFATV